jgi:hypothetical protein
VKIDTDYSPVIVDKNEVPECCRFEILNKLVGKEENSEEYHAAINRYYHQYRKANHKDIMRKMMLHPQSAYAIIKDFVKRRF